MARKEGSTNKNKEFLMSRLQTMYGKDFHPIMQMAANANELQEMVVTAKDDLHTLCKKINEDTEPKEAGGAQAIRDLYDSFSRKYTQSLNEAINAWEKIAPYIAPKYRSIDLSGSIELLNEVIIKDFKGAITHSIKDINDKNLQVLNDAIEQVIEQETDE